MIKNWIKKYSISFSSQRSYDEALAVLIGIYFEVKKNEETFSKKIPWKMSWCYFSEVKKKNQKENPSFSTPKPTLIILTFFPSEWARGKMTIGNQWRKLHAIVNNICIWFFVSILHDLLYWEMLNPAEWGRERAKCHQWQQLLCKSPVVQSH